MSERGNFRGGRGGRTDRGGRGGSSDRGGRGGSQAAGGDRKKENILDLTKYMDKELTVKFSGGREGELLLMLQLIRFALTDFSDWYTERLRSIDEPGAGQCEGDYQRSVASGLHEFES